MLGRQGTSVRMIAAYGDRRGRNRVSGVGLHGRCGSCIRRDGANRSDLELQHQQVHRCSGSAGSAAICSATSEPSAAICSAEPGSESAADAQQGLGTVGSNLLINGGTSASRLCATAISGQVRRHSDVLVNGGTAARTRSSRTSASSSATSWATSRIRLRPGSG